MSGQFWTKNYVKYIPFHLKLVKKKNLTSIFQAYLEQQIEEYERVEQERMEERQIQTKKILERMKIEQSNTIEGIGIFREYNLNEQYSKKYVLRRKRFNVFI